MSRILKLRPFLDFSRTEVNQQEYLVVSCKLNLLQTPILINASLTSLVQMLYYGTDRFTIEQVFKGHFSKDDFEAFLRFLDDNLLLESEKWSETLSLLTSEYFNLSLRQSFLEGKLFAQDPEKRREEIRRFLQEVSISSALTDPDLIILPHIDYLRGYKVYSSVLKSISGFRKKRRCLLIGTDHKFTRRLLSLSNKSYGISDFIVQVDLPFVDQVKEKVGEWIFDDMFNQKTEHSLEITLPFLESVWSKDMVTSFVTMGSIENFRNADQLKSWSDFSAAFRGFTEILNNKLEETVIILAIDFSHLGKYFGDPFELDEATLKETKDFDHSLLDAFFNSSSDKLFEKHLSLNFKFKACGFSSLVFVKAVLESLGAKILPWAQFYEQSLTHNNNCLVSFFGAVCRFS